MKKGTGAKITATLGGVIVWILGNRFVGSQIYAQEEYLGTVSPVAILVLFGVNIALFVSFVLFLYRSTYMREKLEKKGIYALSLLGIYFLAMFIVLFLCSLVVFVLLP